MFMYPLQVSVDDTYVALWVEFDQKLFPLETKFSNLGPGKCVDFGAILEDENSRMGDCQVEGNTFVVLRITCKR